LTPGYTKRWLVCTSVALAFGCLNSAVGAEEISATSPAGAENEATQQGSLDAESVGACVAAHLTARLALERQTLIQVRSELRRCAAAGCPIAIRAECSEWLNQAERQVPTLVLSARTERGDVTEARVTMDGQLVTEQLDGHPLEAQPGPHVLTFDLLDGRRQELKIVVGVGEKDRLVRADFAAPKPTAPATAASASNRATTTGPNLGLSTHRQRDTGLVLILAAAGSALAAGGLTYVGIEQRNSAKDSCAPFCSDAETNRVRRWFILADVAGIAAAATGGLGLYLIITSDHTRSQPAATLGWRKEF
jgi:hypothetical protein